ncbi:MAG: F420-dependent methylenetetrahydromethanopterin dehydrogenase [Candidatus Bathyarchaeota archaeon]
MPETFVKIGILKVGCIGSAPLLEYLLDERAERYDIETRVVGTGASMVKNICENAANMLASYKPHFAIVVSPNATTPGPTAAREVLLKSGILSIIISDSPIKKISKNLEEAGFGYIIPEADSMIGARREFLDPIEMALFNSDTIKVLAVTGVLNLIIDSIDRVILNFKRGEKPILPKLIINKETAIAASGLQNPYARSKAMAAFEISSRVATLTSEGCFLLKEWESYIPIVSAAHEMMLIAARLADEAREIEKSANSVIRKPHAKDGVRLYKTKLIEKPVKPR